MMVWLIILVILSYSNVVKKWVGYPSEKMGGNSVIWQCCKKVGGVYNNVLKYGCFRHSCKHIVASQCYLELFTNFSKTKLNIVYNTLRKISLGSNHLLTITMATMMHPFQIKALQACNIPRHGIFSMFLTSIKSYKSVHICQILPFCSPRTLLHNIDSHENDSSKH